MVEVVADLQPFTKKGLGGGGGTWSLDTTMAKMTGANSPTSSFSMRRRSVAVRTLLHVYVGRKIG
jgi:hypothetical protein